MNAQFYNKKHKNKKKRVYRFRPSSTVDTFLSFVVHDFCEQRREENPKNLCCETPKPKQFCSTNHTFKHANLNRPLSPLSPFELEGRKSF
jgi:hypothetical protein